MKDSETRGFTEKLFGPGQGEQNATQEHEQQEDVKSQENLKRKDRKLKLSYLPDVLSNIAGQTKYPRRSNLANRVALPVLLGVLYGDAKSSFTVSYPALTGILALFIVFYYAGNRKEKLWQVLGFFLGVTAGSICYLWFAGRPFSSVKATLYSMLADISIIFGTIVFWYAFPKITGTRMKLFEKISKRNLTIYSLIAGSILGILFGDIPVGLAMPPTLIWIGVIALVALLRDWEPLAVISFGAGVILSTMLVHWNIISLVKYSLFETWLIYRDYWLLIVVQMCLIFAVGTVQKRGEGWSIGKHPKETGAPDSGLKQEVQ